VIKTSTAEVRYVTHLRRRGRIEVICGCMFSGKTEELIRRIRRAQIANKAIQIFKPITDDRYDDSDVMTHNEDRLQAFPVPSADKILSLVKTSTTVVGIDEAQFFDDTIVDVCQELADRGCRVIIAALDMDSNLEPFGPAPKIMAVAERVTKLTAVCVICGEEAHRSKRLIEGTVTIEVGGVEKYEARCRDCFNQ